MRNATTLEKTVRKFNAAHRKFKPALISVADVKGVGLRRNSVWFFLRIEFLKKQSL